MPYDPERARHLLTEAGYPGGRGFPVLDAVTPGDRPIAAALSHYLQAQWVQDMGVKITWSHMDWGRYLDRLDREPPHLWVAGWIADYPDPDSFLRAAQWRVRTRWQNEAFDGLAEGARRVMDQRERMRMYQEADRILVGESPILPLLYGRSQLLVKPWISKLPPSSFRRPLWKDVIVERH